MNDPFVRMRASELANRLVAEAGKDADAQVRLAFQLGLAREPMAADMTDASSFLVEQTVARQQQAGRISEETAQALALTDFCQMLFSFNEFMYVD